MQGFITAFTPRFTNNPSNHQCSRFKFISPRQNHVVRCSSDVPSQSVEDSAMAAAAATFILKRAASGYVNNSQRPAASTVSQALLSLEKEQRKNKVRCEISQLLGQWRLVLVANPKSSNPFSRAYYFPIRAHQTFTPDGVNETGTFNNGIFFLNGALSLRLSGPFRWSPEVNRLDFSVDHADFKIGSWEGAKDELDPEGRSLEGRTAKTLPFFSFFLIKSDLAAARGRGGGLALYTRVPDDEHL